MEGTDLTLRVTINLTLEDVKRLAEALGPSRTSVQAPLPATPQSGRLLTTAETAELLGISKSSLYGLRYVGEAPPAVKVGSRLRWRRADVEAWMEQHLEERPTARW